MMLGRFPELHLLYANPNAGKRTPGMVGYLKAEGWKKGIPDLTLPVARKGYHGMYIEMKRADGTEADVTTEQAWWIERLCEHGYYAVWARGAAHAWQVIEWYLSH